MRKEGKQGNGRDPVDQGTWASMQVPCKCHASAMQDISRHLGVHSVFRGKQFASLDDAKHHRDERHGCGSAEPELIIGGQGGGEGAWGVKEGCINHHPFFFQG